MELGTRNIKIALRRLRRFAREGAAEELDLDSTIRSTARNAGYLDLKMVPERHNAVKVLLFLDIGGSMDDHIQICEELFSAARGEFKHLEYFYFHNMVYEGLWKDNRRRYTEKIETLTVLRTFSQEYQLILVGDATMSPYEISYPGGSVEHFNPEAGDVWLNRLLAAFSPRHLAQPAASQPLELYPLDPDGAGTDGRADVSADPGRVGTRHSGVATGALNRRWACD